MIEISQMKEEISFCRKKTDDIRVCTFDSIKSVTTKFPDYMVLSPKGEDKYEVKYVPEDFDRHDQGFFGRAKPEYIIVKGECLEKLKQQGYEMDCWQKGTR